MTQIADNAFAGCKKLTRVTIGKQVQIVGQKAFSGCKKLKSVVFKTALQPKVYADAFKGVRAACVYRVPAKSATYYKLVLSGKRVTTA